MIYRIQLILCLFISQAAWAGGWVFGGGDQVGNKHNPWFLQSTQKIQFCLVVDGKSISANEIQIKELVLRSLEYWRSDFFKLDKLVPTRQKTNQLSLPTQGFELVSCNQNPELRFIFGDGALSAEERSFLERYDFVVGSVRTDYDVDLLKGRGFIYIPSDLGPNSFVKPDQIERPWQKSGLLFRALVHEIGHTFGLQHYDRGLMMADYPERILKKKYFSAFTSVDNLPSTLLPQLNSLKIAEATVSQVEHGIKIVLVREKLLQPEVVYIPSGISLEWSITVKSTSGEIVPMLIRSSPFLYETYSLSQKKIQNLTRIERQCRPDSCIRD